MQQTNTAAARAREPQYFGHTPQLLVAWEPWWPIFLHNLRDVFTDLSRGESTPLPYSPPGEFWPDVFVNRPMPWKNFGESAVIHLLAVLCVVGGTRLWLLRQHVTVSEAVNQTKLIYYNVSDYLPQIHKTSPPLQAARAQKGAPVFAKQEIISVPRSPDNSTQTILNPPHPNLLPRSVNLDLPNLVAWSVAPQPPVAALAHPKLTMPAIEFTPVQPPPDVRRTTHSKMALPEVAAVQPASEARRESPPKMVKLPEIAVVEPPPAVDSLMKRVDAVDMARLPLQPAVAAPKPPAPVAERPLEKAAALPPVTPPPPPSTQRDTSVPAMGQIIALSLQPKAPEKEIKIPDASRNGIFAASPSGKVGAPGVPEIAAVKQDAAKGSGDRPEITPQKEPGTPDGISISRGVKNDHAPTSPVVARVQGEAPRLPDRPKMIAFASIPDIAHQGSQAYSTSSINEAKVEDRVFSGRKIYSMQLNMPNLTSAGGSWIVRFAELNKTPQPGDLSTPVATNKVDPAYPAQLIRDQVEGNVVLYAVIHADGTVGEVRVLEGFHQQLDENARLALLRWHFRPAMKNGVPVDLEAVVQIPFRARKIGFKY